MYKGCWVGVFTLLLVVGFMDLFTVKGEGEDEDVEAVHTERVRVNRRAAAALKFPRKSGARKDC